MRGICLTLALVLTSTLALAKSHFLPDYQGAGLDERVQEFENPHTTNTCSVYGMYSSSSQSGMICSVTYPASGLTCYTCQPCDSAYQYTTVECPAPTYSLSEQCGGKYKNCNCDITLYPTTFTTTGCPRGLIPDTDDYCEDKPDGTKHYACVRPVCKPDNIMVEDCQAQGDGHNCIASTEENCTDYCDISGCQDKCAYLRRTGQARSDCQYGCAVGKEVSGCTDLCYECGEKPESPTNTCADIYDGKSNTTAIISQLGADALAATAANQYYVGDKNGDFGQGKWYLPSIGELVDMYGVDPDQITSGSGTSGATGGYIERINNALIALYDKGIDTDILSDTYWSSSEHSADHVWTLTASSANGSGNRSYTLKDYPDRIYVRPFLQVENCFVVQVVQYNAPSPQIGQIVYDDKSWGNVRDYYSWSSSKPVGIIASVNRTDGSVKIVSLKNLTFSTTDSSGNFDADNPYGGKYEESTWAPYDKRAANVIGVPNYSSDKLKTMLKKCAAKDVENSCPIDNAGLVAIFDGKSNTQKIVAQLGEKGLVAYATTQFYVGDKNGDFGQGNWYLPAIGELIDMYGTDTSKINASISDSGALGNVMAKINAALATLKDKGAEAGKLTEHYWSSSEGSAKVAWKIVSTTGFRNLDPKESAVFTRPILLLENCFNPSIVSSSDENIAPAPKIGDVMYEDKSYGSAENYDANKKAVGIVIAVATDGSVKIISLKDLTFSSYNSAGNFNPENPYGARGKLASWATGDKVSEDITEIPSPDLTRVYRQCITCKL